MLPQLDPSSYLSQLFWLAVTFIALYAVLARITLPRIREVLHDRQTKISSDLEKAARLKTEAEAARSHYMTGLEEAKNKAKELFAQAAETIKKETQERTAKLDATIATQLDEADIRIAKVKEQTIAQFTPVSQELAELIVDKLLQAPSAEGSNVIKFARGH